MESILIINTFVLVFLSAILGGLLAYRFRFPMLIGYIAAGMLFGNVFLRFTNRELLQIVADVGVTLLLFTLGIEFSFHRLRHVLKNIGPVAMLQVVVSIMAFSVLFFLAAFNFPQALFLATVASLSSTAVAVKILSEKGELDSVPGEVLTGWLIVQDLAVIPIMVLLPTISAIGGATWSWIIPLLMSLAKAGIYIGAIIGLGRFGVPLLLNWIAAFKSRELLLLTTVGVVFLAAVTSYAMGLSAGLGAFIAGLLIAETSQNHAIFAEVRPLRDVFAVVFFVTLGMTIPAAFFLNHALILSLAVLTVLGIKFIVTYFLTRSRKYHPKTSFIVALGLLPVSEFGFLIAREGLQRGILTQDDYFLAVAVTFISLIIGAPLLTNGQNLYYHLFRTVREKLPHLFPVSLPKVSDDAVAPLQGHVVLLGYGRVGKYIGRALSLSGIPFLVVDFNHATVAKLIREGQQVIYGDPADTAVLAHANIPLARAVVITIPDRHTQELVVTNVLTLNQHISIICRTHHEEDQRRLKSLGVTTIVQPEFEASLSITNRLLAASGLSESEIQGKISRLKIEHGLG